MSRSLKFLSLFFFTSPVLAYELDGNRWSSGETEFHIDIPGGAPSGVSWNEAFEDAMAQWSDETDFTYLLNPEYQDPCEGYSATGDATGFPDGEGDSFNGADFSEDVCGNDFGEGVLAITLTLAFPGNLGFSLIGQADILFNNEFDWDIYTGPTRSEVDFRRVALHELGHALGLGHEQDEEAIMSPTIAGIDQLQADDIAGANALYGGPGDCEITDLSLNSVVENSLEDNDCKVLELYGGGDDSSFVDAYRLNLESETSLSIMMESAMLDSVLLVTDDKLNGVDFDDDSLSECDALINGTFPAGEYLVLANTYVDPVKCPGNTGSYRLSISDNSLPILPKARSAFGPSSKSIFHGGASSNNGVSYKSNFASSEVINVDASINPDPDHIGENATFYIVALLSTGHKFAKLGSGKFTQLGKLSSIPAFSQTESLQPHESFSIFQNLKPDALGVSNISVSVFVGYSLEASPSEIYFHGKPIVFSVQ